MRREIRYLGTGDNLQFSRPVLPVAYNFMEIYRATNFNFNGTKTSLFLFYPRDTIFRITSLPFTWFLYFSIQRGEKAVFMEKERQRARENE